LSIPFKQTLKKSIFLSVLSEKKKIYLLECINFYKVRSISSLMFNKFAFDQVRILLTKIISQIVKGLLSCQLQIDNSM